MINFYIIVCYINHRYYDNFNGTIDRIDHSQLVTLKFWMLVLTEDIKNKQAEIDRSKT